MQPSPLWAIANMATAGHCGRDCEMRAVLTCFNVESALKAWVENARELRRARKRWVPRHCADRRPKPCCEIGRSLPDSAWQPCRLERLPAADFSTQNGLDPRMDGLAILLRTSSEIPETWLVFDWPQGQPEPYHIYTAWLDGPPERISLLRLSRQRFQIEQYFQRDKDDLGLDHFERRSSARIPSGHLALAATAYLFEILLAFLVGKKNTS